MPVFETFDEPTPVGSVRLFTRDRVLCAVCFEDSVHRATPGLRRRFGDVDWRPGTDAPAVRGLRRFLAGELDALDALEVDPGGTPFQAAVWSTLRRVPAGRTVSYGELAARAGRPAAARAIGAAMGANPVPIVIPCHRVVRSDGDLWRYGGGLERKRWLLEHEGAAPGTAPGRLF